MRLTRRNLFWLLLVVVGLGLFGSVVAWRSFAIDVRNRLHPTDVQSFDDYLARFGEPASLGFREADNETFLEVTANIPFYYYLVLPDGNPTYVFSKSGQLVDWSPYSMDDAHFQERWRNSKWKGSVSVADSRRWLSTQN